MVIRMSAYSDWKCGALSDDEYAFCCSWEDVMDKAAEDKMFEDLYRDDEEEE